MKTDRIKRDLGDCAECGTELRYEVLTTGDVPTRGVWLTCSDCSHVSEWLHFKEYQIDGIIENWVPE